MPQVEPLGVGQKFSKGAESWIEWTLGDRSRSPLANTDRLIPLQEGHFNINFTFRSNIAKRMQHQIRIKMYMKDTIHAYRVVQKRIPTSFLG